MLRLAMNTSSARAREMEHAEHLCAGGQARRVGKGDDVKLDQQRFVKPTAKASLPTVRLGLWK